MTATSPVVLDHGPRPRGAESAFGRALSGLATRLSGTTLAAAGLGILSAVLYLWNLTASGYANAYYSAAALAASKSWTAWFFGSLDAANFITVDKPPLATMLMGLSVRLFGLSSASILLPEALLGVASVLLTFVIVKRQFGPVAGTIAGLVTAVTPVAALMFRYDHPDALMTFLMLVAAYGTQRAIEKGAHRWMALAGLAVGLAFLTKYLQGVLVGPALVLAYAVAARASVRRRIAGILTLGAASLATAGAWIAAVELTPASLKPYIGGSTNGSVLDLVLGYDGLGRIFGASSGQGQGANFSGTPGILRLFNSEFGGQISWLLPFAGIALVVGLLATLRARRTDLGRAGYLLWGGWLAVHAVVFSFMSGIVHSYYAVAMAPAIGALVGAGIVEMWRLRERSRLGGLLLAGSTVVTVAWAAVLLARSSGFVPWLAPVILVGGLAAAALLAVPLRNRTYGLAIAGLALAAMLAGPVAYTVDTMNTAYTGSIVSAGPAATSTDLLSGTASSTGMGGMGGPGAGGPSSGSLRGGGQMGQPPTGGTSTGGGPGSGTSGGPGSGTSGGTAMAGGGTGGGMAAATDTALAEYLVANQGQATWVVAVSNSMEAAQLELATGQSVMAIGGWSGNDQAITLDAFKALVSSGQLRYVIVGGQGGMGGGQDGGQSGNAAIFSWVRSVGTAITVGNTTIYDLSGVTVA